MWNATDTTLNDFNGEFMSQIKRLLCFVIYAQLM